MVVFNILSGYDGLLFYSKVVGVRFFSSCEFRF